MAGMPITIVCDESLSVGFELAGTKAFGVRTPSEAREILLDLAVAGRFGIVLMADDLMESLSDRERTRLDNSQSPIFVPMPIRLSGDEAGGVIASQIVEQLVQRAIGRRISIAS